MDTSHELAPPLINLLYAMAEEGADDWATGPGGDVWAGLLRDGAEIARRLGEQLEANAAVARDEIDAEDWAALGTAFGVIVRRDHRSKHCLRSCLHRRATPTPVPEPALCASGT